jgi:DNA-binding NtrC family response regulator
MNKSQDRKILHVDDDPAILRIVASTLSKRGYSVISVSDPKLAIASLKEASTRVVILDIDMPEKNGLSLLEEIKAIDGSIQVIMLTGMVSMATILRATQLGAEECHFKPISDLDELGDAADRAYEKMLRWWRVLREWRLRNSMASSVVQLLGPESNSQPIQNDDPSTWPTICQAFSDITDVFTINTFENR